MRKDWRRLVRAIEDAGGEVTLRKAGHYRIAGPGGIYFTSATPSDHRARLNLVSDLKGIGLDVRGAL